MKFHKCDGWYRYRYYTTVMFWTRLHGNRSYSIAPWLEQHILLPDCDEMISYKFAHPYRGQGDSESFLQRIC